MAAAVASAAVEGAAEAPQEDFKVVVVHSDMPEDMQEDLKEMVKAAFAKHTVYKDLAMHVKQAFDAKHPPPDNKATSGVYHCIAGMVK